MAQKVSRYLGYYCRKICHQYLSKIAQSGHPVGRHSVPRCGSVQEKVCVWGGVGARLFFLHFLICSRAQSHQLAKIAIDAKAKKKKTKKLSRCNQQKLIKAFPIAAYSIRIHKQAGSSRQVKCSNQTLQVIAAREHLRLMIRGQPNGLSNPIQDHYRWCHPGFNPHQQKRFFCPIIYDGFNG